MTANMEEQLSALLDGELPEAEAPMVLRRVARDESLQKTALRYSLIGDALRDELPAGRVGGLVGRVRDELRQAPAPGRAAAPRANHLRRYAGGFAVAASVALVALVALPGRQEAVAPPTISATEIASPAPDRGMNIQPIYTRAAGGGPDRLTRYYVNHSEYAPPVSGRGALTRIIVIQREAAAVDEKIIEPEGELAGEPGKTQ